MNPAVGLLIGGPSCSGKSTIARRLSARLEPAVLLSTDQYYRGLEHVPEQKRLVHNFDHPDAADLELLSRHFETLLEGRAVETPVYDFTTHSRKREAVLLDPAPMVIVEGLHALHRKDMRDRALLRVFVESDVDTCLARRIERDTKERGRAEKSIRRQFAETVQPMYEEFIAPLRERADLTVDGSAPVEQSTAVIAEALKSRGWRP